MWHSLVNRRDVLELALTVRPSVALRTMPATTEWPDISIKGDDALLSWGEDPVGGSFPTRVIVVDDRADDLLAALNANPAALSPFTAFCRIVTVSEARAYARSSSRTVQHPQLLPALIGLCYAEALLLSDGQIRLDELSPAICKRTLSFAWAKAVAARVPGTSRELLAEGWAEAFARLGADERSEAVRVSVRTVLPILFLASDIADGEPPSSRIESLCHALAQDNRVSQDEAWRALASDLPAFRSLSDLSNASREDRGNYFQAVMRYLYPARSGDETSPAVCGFLATQIAPGSLEHMDLMLARDDPRLPLWYSFFAGLQRPERILSMFGGLGLRVMRDVQKQQTFSESPGADISLREFRVLTRHGLDPLSRKLGHANEVEIELAPLVSCTFRFGSRGPKQPELFSSSTETSIPSAAKDKLEIAHLRLKDIVHVLESVLDSIGDASGHASSRGGATRGRKR